ncbi:MAG: HNH endonuclease [Chloroflexi bacterium]|nr:HNH endonuclease [Chloroflexota bacterium]
MVELSVLVLNQNYEPLNVCAARRALVLVIQGKAEVLENGRGYIRAASEAFPLPSVIRLVYLVRRPRPQRKLTRREVFIRDRYICQYCGRETRELTLDHVIPRYRGGRHEWENVVSACKPCNQRKGNRTPSEVGLRLRRPPIRPRLSSYYLVYQHLQRNGEWAKYVPEWERGD